MEQLFRVFLLKEIHWLDALALIVSLRETPSVRRRLGFGSLPDWSTLRQFFGAMAVV